MVSLYLIEQFEVSFPAYLGSFKVGQNMCNWDSVRAGFDDHGALDARFGQDQMITNLAHECETLPFKHLD